jgi:hypothetical protein
MVCLGKKTIHSPMGLIKSYMQVRSLWQQKFYWGRGMIRKQAGFSGIIQIAVVEIIAD